MPSDILGPFYIVHFQFFILINMGCNLNLEKENTFVSCSSIRNQYRGNL